MAGASSSGALAALVIVSGRVLFGLGASRIALHLFPVQSGGPPNGFAPRSVVGSFIRWDALHFRAIAESGYGVDSPERASFFPLYPSISRLFTDGLGLPYGAVALGVSWVALFVATWSIIALARTLAPDPTNAYRAGMLFAWFPASVFLISGYSEALFVAMVAPSILFAVKDRPVLSAVFAAGAAAARPEGILVAMVVGLVTLLRRGYLKAAGVAALSATGIAAVSVLFLVKYSDPFMQLQVQELWNRHHTWPLRPLVWSVTQMATGGSVSVPEMHSNTVAVFILDDLVIVAGLAALVWLVAAARSDHRLRPLVPFTVVYVLLIVSQGPSGLSPEGAARIIMCVVPLYLVVVHLREKAWTAVITVSASLAVLFQVVFNLGYWFT